MHQSSVLPESAKMRSHLSQSRRHNRGHSPASLRRRVLNWKDTQLPPDDWDPGPAPLEGPHCIHHMKPSEVWEKLQTATEAWVSIHLSLQGHLEENWQIPHLLSFAHLNTVKADSMLSTTFWTPESTSFYSKPSSCVRSVPQSNDESSLETKHKQVSMLILTTLRPTQLQCN